MTYVHNGAPVETGGPEDRLLPWDRVQDIAGISRTTAWRMQQTGVFPAPVAVSPGRVGWWESELTAWKHSRGVGGLAPPRKPRLPGMPRRLPPKPLQTPAAVSRQGDLALEYAAAPVKATKPSRKARAAHADQIDFGF